MANNNINISPDMINNLANILKNNSTNNTDVKSEKSQPSNSNSTINIDEILNKFSNSNTSNSSPSSSFSDTSTNSSTASIDIETILKIKSIMETLNKKDDPRANLIYSLKPYLRKSKQAKLDQYVNLLKITQVSSLLRNEKGDSNNAK